MKTYYEITIDGSAETVGDNNNFKTEQEARDMIPQLQSLGADWADGKYDVHEKEISDDDYIRCFGDE